MTNTLTAEQKQWHCDGYLLYTLKDSGTYRKGEPVMVNEDMIRVSGDNADAVLARLQALLSPSLPLSGEAAGYMLIYPGCECGPTETCESVAYQKLAESPPGTELRPVYFHPSPLTNEPVGVTEPQLSEDEQAYIDYTYAEPQKLPAEFTSGYMQAPMEPSPIKSPHSAGVFPKDHIPEAGKMVEPVGVTISLEDAEYIHEIIRCRVLALAEPYKSIEGALRDRLSAAIGERG